MRKIKKGDIVGRKSYNKDILFIVERIIETTSGNSIAILKGIDIRIQADSELEDLEIIDANTVLQKEKENNKRFEETIKKSKYLTEILTKRSQKVIYTGRILHLDGDKRYSEKSSVFYKKMGLKAFVKNISENRQANVVNELLYRYKPDILVITGHDGMIKKGRYYNDIYNYRNSKYFINAVRKVREKNILDKDLVIFAGACQSYYEELIEAGANFASSPARILIDFLDPLIVAERIATTDSHKFLTIKDIEDELRDGERGINGVGAMGKKKIMEIY